MHSNFFFFSGCKGHCKGCQNPELGDFEYGMHGKEYLEEYKVFEKIKEFDILINKIVVLGGEPLDQHIPELFAFLKELRTLDKEIGLFTSYEDHEIMHDDETYQIISLVDFIKYGKYIKELEVEDNIQFGYKLATSNQYIKEMAGRQFK